MQHGQPPNYSSVKERHFIALNEADNFRIEYWTAAKDAGGKKKGEIQCAGYYVERCDEITDEFGIKLKPWSSRRRTWHMICDTSESREEWIRTFQNATWRSSAPSDPNPLIASAFTTAYEAVRWKYGFWGWYWGWGTEAERLADLISDVLAREVVDAAISTIADSPASGTIIDAVRTAVYSSVVAAVTPAWAANRTAAEALQPQIEPVIKSNTAPLFEKQKELKEQVVSKVTSITNPFLADMGTKVLKPFLNVFCKFIAGNFVNAIRSYQKTIYEHLGESDLNYNFADISSYLLNRWDCSGTWGISGTAYDQLSQICNDELNNPIMNAVFEVLAGFSSGQVWYMWWSRLRDMLYRAAYTFSTLKEKLGLESCADRLKALKEVMPMLIHDGKIYIKSLLMDLFNAMLGTNIATMITNPAKEMIAPIQEVSDGRPITLDIISTTCHHPSLSR